MKKYLLVSLLLASQIASANCNLKSASILENEHKVGPILNLTKSFDPAKGQCIVSYNVEVDGENHPVNSSATGPEREDVVCGYAIERSRRQLLLNLGGQFKTEATMICSDGEPVKTSIKIGDTILESEVGINPKLKSYWPYKDYSKCRVFKERYVHNKAQVEYNGVICQKADNNWLVVDKW
jgi:hypothetical protein